uniref:Retrovirus-related Pol polyprotein from transposon TNT 1-94-like beta-barrel domain-containing protein n=1 Tax=Micrurus paraensis TaxID=1970185 RepID=A0A2D4K535_9SAUR
MGGESFQQKPASTKAQDGGRAAETVNFVKRCYTCGSTEISGDAALRGETEEQRDGCRSIQHTWSGSSAPFFMAVSTTERTTNKWLLDSGASQHIANNPQAFSGLQPAKQMWVSLADGQRVNGEGNVYVPEIGDTLYNVFYVPALEHNLLSISVKPEIDICVAILFSLIIYSFSFSLLVIGGGVSCLPHC